MRSYCAGLIFAVGIAIVATQVQTPYDDTFVRDVMFPYAAAAYSDSPEDCFKSTTDFFLLGGPYNVSCSSRTFCHAYMALSFTRKAIIIAFRGTEDISQLLVEINDTSVLPMMSGFGGLVHPYFGQAFNSLWNGGLHSRFMQIKDEYHIRQKYDIWLTGHSLGGALATLCMANWNWRNTDQIVMSRVKLVTFGEPRVGDARFASLLDKNYILRITHDRDLVVHAPSSSSYQHHMTEIHFPDTSMCKGARYINCIGDEDPNCAYGEPIPTSLCDHYFYYQKDVSVYGESGCKNPGLVRTSNQQFSVPKERGFCGFFEHEPCS